MFIGRSIAIFNAILVFVVVGLLRKMFILTLGILEVVIGFLLIYLNSAFLFSVIPAGAEEATDGVKIFVKTNGVHTDLCLPVETEYLDWKTFIPAADFPAVTSFQYVSIGWGDKGFFLDTPTWADLKFSTAFNAAFLGGDAAMHVQYFSHEPQVSTTVKMKYVTPEGYRRLIGYIKDSFTTDDQGQVELIPGKGYWSDDNFYEAKGSYHLYNTCNAWTNEALKTAGIRTAWLALFSDGIMRHLD